MDTFFWPVIQAGVLGMKEEEKGLGRVWEAIGQSFDPAPAPASASAPASTEQEGKGDDRPKQVGVQVDLTSGYFGLYDAYKRMVIDSPAPVRVIAASPKVSPTTHQASSTSDGGNMTDIHARQTAFMVRKVSRGSYPKATHTSRVGSTRTPRKPVDYGTSLPPRA